MTKQFNFTRFKAVYNEALESYDKTVAFDINIGRGRFLFLMFLAEDDERDMLYLYMRNTTIMRKLKMYGNHKKGDFNVYISGEVQKCMIEEMELQSENGTFCFERFLSQLNEAIPQEVRMEQKVQILRNDRDVIKTVAIEDVDKTVLIGTKKLSKGKPQDKTLRKLYMYTEASEKEVTDFITDLKKANMTVAWTTDDQRYRAANINVMLNSFQ